MADVRSHRVVPAHGMTFANKPRMNEKQREKAQLAHEAAVFSRYSGHLNGVRMCGNFATRLINKAAMSEQTGALGGYLVPAEVELAVHETLAEESIFHSRAWLHKMESNRCGVPAFDVSASHATGASPLFAGMVMGFKVEGQALPESEPKFSNAELVCRDLYALVYASNQLIADGEEALGIYLMHQFREMIRWTVDSMCFNGNGLTQPAGIVQSPSTVPVTRQTGGTITAQDCGNMVVALLPGCFRNAVWAASPTAVSKVAQLSNYIGAGDSRDRPLCGYLLGRPLLATEQLPVVGTRGDLMLFDPSMYALGERSIEVGISTETQDVFYSNSRTFRVWWRGDGQTIARGTATLADGTTTAGAYVALN